MATKTPFYKELIIHLNIVVVVACIIGLVICHHLTNDNYKKDTITTEIKPYAIATLDDGSFEYLFDLSKYDYSYSGIMFYSSHQIIHVYSLGSEIYSFAQDGGAWGSTTGSAFHFVEINEGMSVLAVIVTPVYEEVRDQQITFYIGSSYTMYNELMVKSMPRFIVSLFILIISIFLIFYYMFMRKKLNLQKSVIYLAYFAFFCGVWSLTETDVSALIARNRAVDAIVSYYCLMLVVPPFVMFFDEYLKINSKWFIYAASFISMCQFVILSFLHFTKIAEYRQTLPFMQIILVISTLYLVIRVVIKLVNKSYTRKVFICAIGLTLFSAAVIIDVSQYYLKIGDADIIGRYTFLIFLVLLTWDLLKGTYDVIEKGRRAKQLEVFALTDSMTGLLNRNAFESHSEADNNLNGLVAVVADANGLKACNDTLGHEAGDEYITVVAEIFSSVFGKYGNCYRTGGDEFCCIIPSGKHLNMERLKKLFLAKIYTENLEGGYQFDIGVAIGYASYNAEIDDDFKAVVKRADNNMYENKRESKKLG